MENQKKYDVIALGELLIDFTPAGTSAQGNPVLEQNPGGAPCNVLAMLARYGRSTGFIGKIGNDIHGRFLCRAVREAGIGCGGLVMSDEVHTTLAFVSMDESGDRSFSFYRNPGADMALTEDEVNLDMIRCSRIFHFGTLSMTHEGVRKATIRAAACARENGCLVSFDPNLRPPLWADMEEARKQMLYGVSLCHVLKITDEELRFMTGIEDEKQAVSHLQAVHGIPLILVTAGAFGSTAYWAKEALKAEAFLTDRTIDTTGAGDTFCGCCLNYLLDHPVETLDREGVRDMLTTASAAASIVTTRKGALKSMPEPGEIEEVVRSSISAEQK
ncbi:carbohydrate kinase family protein [Enterocloster bolteae]|uniref:carbohydrate kinase family protein n=1 Tax=Enterocloster bolteae TaxID=208479 RepID=UPI002674C366|nr:carbohydrate kinase [Enterocloster bolteae]